MRKQIRNRGFSLVELIVAFAILGTATLGIGSFYVAATRSSTSVNREAQLHNEAQLATNQMEKLIISTDLAACYRVGNAFVMSDAEATGEALPKVLYIFNTNTNGGVELQLLKWNGDGNIYYREGVLKELADEKSLLDIDIDGTADFVQDMVSEWELLGEGVQDFAAVMDEAGKKLNLNVTYANVSDTFTVERVLRFRNNILINPETFGAVNENVNVAFDPNKNEITDVVIDVNPSVAAPNAGAKVTWEVRGLGSFNRNISKWVISTTEDMATPLDEAYASIDALGNLKLDLAAYKGANGGVGFGPVYVQAKVQGGEENGAAVYIDSNVEMLHVIENMEIQLLDGGTASKVVDLYNAQAKPMAAKTGMSYQFAANVVGNGLDSSYQRVIWSIANVNGAKATITADGLVEVDKYSPNGTFDVVAKLAKHMDLSVRFTMQVGDGHTESQGLVISGPQTIKRGGEEQYTVTLNGKAVDPEDCIWTVYVPDSWSEADKKAVRIGTTGILSVKDSLNFDFSGEIVVDAKLKSNPSIASTPRQIEIAKVTLQITNPENGVTLKRGGELDFACAVTGIEDYTIDWTVARSLNPTHYFTSRGNTSISGSMHEATLKFGSDEPAEVTWLNVIAQIHGTDVADEVKVDTKGVITVTITQIQRTSGWLGFELRTVPTDGTGVIDRVATFFGQTINNPVLMSCDVSVGDAAKLKWTISQGGNVISTGSGSSHSFSTKNKGQVTIRVEYEGLEKEVFKEIKVKTN